MSFSLKASLCALTGQDPGSHRFLLAVSGGLDSVVLSHAFRENGLSFAIAHCNFQLRGKDSDADEAFVRKLSAQLEAPFFVQRFDTLAFTRETGDSVQMAARDLRYTWLEEVRAAQGFHWIVTAHHLDDALETFFINFLRGSGLRGLVGIPKKNGHIIRPFLALSRKELEQEYLLKGLSHREDATNAESTYLRNKIRHFLIPVLQQLEPEILRRAAQNFHALHDASQLLDYAIHQIQNTALALEGQRIYLDWKQLETLPAPETVLLELLGKYGFNETQCAQAWQIRNGQAGKTFESSSHILLIDRGRFVLEPAPREETPYIHIHDTEEEILFPGGRLQFKAEARPAENFPSAPETIFVPLHSLSYPIVLRKWRPGDNFCPSGMGGKHKKIQDFLTDLRMDRLRKNRVWILENGNGNIIWVLGLRQDERFRFSTISDDSYLQIRFFPTEFV